MNHQTLSAKHNVQVVHFTPPEECTRDSEPGTIKTEDIKTEPGVRISSVFSLDGEEPQSSDECSAVKQEHSSDTVDEEDAGSFAECSAVKHEQEREEESQSDTGIFDTISLPVLLYIVCIT